MTDDHDDVRNPHLYHDRTVQNWHRDTQPRTAYAMDIDLMGWCAICHEPLYLIESTTVEKSPPALYQLARMAGVPALVIRHENGVIRAAKETWPHRRRWVGAERIAGVLLTMRQLHNNAHHEGRRANV